VSTTIGSQKVGASGHVRVAYLSLEMKRVSDCFQVEFGRMCRLAPGNPDSVVAGGATTTTMNEHGKRVHKKNPLHWRQWVYQANKVLKRL